MEYGLFGASLEGKGAGLGVRAEESELCRCMQFDVVEGAQG